ncbi:Catalase-related peroxidase [Bradyrhizobium ivorense]|uniref:catalase n=1 Tax=Bradyrhizobium ivorense TaxID=2511166 RepID=A0A508SX88_9BRAD|nr:catalase [Bradyrhizobium ivorense]VIO66351.1 Catalase-related peroxidase [Bradyrhizobium ivorense]
MPKPPTRTVTPASIVEAMRAPSHGPSDARASFASGQCVRGTYLPSNRASEITKSRSFTTPCRVLGRFAVDGGNSGAADADRRMLHGFSFRLGSNGHRSDILTQSAPVHYARTLAQMLGFLEVRMPGPDGNPDPAKVAAFSAANPETLHQADHVSARPPTASFAGTTYWGVHAFPATNAKGETRFIKFKVSPVGGDLVLSEDEARAQPADFLHDDLKIRIAAGDVRFSLMALLDRPGDPVMDVTIRWPDEDHREAVRLGTIVITRIAPNDACDAISFDPANLAEGIGPPPDEIFAARSTAYGLKLLV